MNLYEYSELHSIDIALHYRDSESYNKLYDYFQKYIWSKINGESLVTGEFENSLSDLQAYVVNKFVETKITKAKTYLFSRDIVPKYDVFIKENRITLKLPLKNVDSSQIENHQKNLNFLKRHKAIISVPSDSYQYYTWDIDLIEHTRLELIDLHEEIRNISTKS